jgi:hypothetical protein
MSATVVKPPIAPSAHAGRGPAVMLGLALLIGLGFVGGFAVPYFAGGEELARYPDRQGWLFLHIGGGMVALIVGPGQLWLGLANRKIDVHRKHAHCARLGVRCGIGWARGRLDRHHGSGVCGGSPRSGASAPGMDDPQLRGDVRVRVLQNPGWRSSSDRRWQPVGAVGRCKLVLLGGATACD